MLVSELFQYTVDRSTKLSCQIIKSQYARIHLSLILYIDCVCYVLQCFCTFVLILFLKF